MQYTPATTAIVKFEHDGRQAKVETEISYTETCAKIEHALNTCSWLYLPTTHAMLYIPYEKLRLMPIAVTPVQYEK
jgi:hypothetical protein